MYELDLEYGKDAEGGTRGAIISLFISSIKLSRGTDREAVRGQLGMKLEVMVVITRSH